jgi:hypothetical protein
VLRKEIQEKAELTRSSRFLRTRQSEGKVQPRRPNIIRKQSFQEKVGPGMLFDIAVINTQLLLFNTFDCSGNSVYSRSDIRPV